MATAADLNKLVDAVLAAAKGAEGGDDAAQKARALDGLRALRKEQVTTKVLADTQAGRRVRALGKHADSEIAAAAAGVVSTWKELVRGEADKGSAAAEPAAKPPAAAAKASPPEGPAAEPAGAPAAAAAAGGKAERGAGAPARPLIKTGDDVRDKCRAALLGALLRAVEEGGAAGAGPGDAAAAAEGVEEEVYRGQGGVTPAYKAKFRALHFNLKDEKNPDLRRKVLSGEIRPEVLVCLAPEELASDEKRGENDRIREKKLFDSAPSAAKQATTDQFQCGKCRQRKCTYYQMQTRSADEPMTTFVSCLNCNNRWKFC